MNNVTIRPCTSADQNFVISTWLRSYKYSSKFAEEISKEVYYEYHHKIVERILNRATVLVACDPNDVSVFFGYLVYETLHDKPLLQFGYVKKDFRNLGIFSLLLQSSDINLDNAIFTHLTPSSEKLRKAHPTLTYNPYLV